MEELEQIGVAQLVIKLQGTGTMWSYFLLLSGCLEPLPQKGTTGGVHKGVGGQATPRLHTESNYVSLLA